MLLSQSPEPRICVREDAWDDPSCAPSKVSIVYFLRVLWQPCKSCERLTVSIELFAMYIMMSIVELSGKWRVVLAFQPSDDFPSRMGVEASVYELPSITHVTIPV